MEWDFGLGGIRREKARAQGLAFPLIWVGKNGVYLGLEIRGLGDSEMGLDGEGFGDWGLGDWGIR
jgi:hypothetical protein